MNERRTRDLRDLVEEPVIVNGPEGVAKIVKVQGLNQEGIRAELVRPIEVRSAVRGCEDHNSQQREGRVGTHPLQDLKAVGAGHLQIEQQKVRKRVLGAVGVPARALEISNGDRKSVV